MIFSERRRSIRVEKRLEVRFLATEERTAITSNISETGLFISTLRGLDAGIMLNIKIKLPNAADLSLEGNIVRTFKSAPGLVVGVKSGMGIQLLNPSKGYLNYVQTLLN